MKSLLALILVASTACLVGACASGGQPVAAKDSTVTTAAPIPTSSPPTRREVALVMPDLRGMFWADAEPALRTIGWTGVLIKAPDLPDSPYRQNQIAAQVPAPGQVIAGDAPITLQFAP